MRRTQLISILLLGLAALAISIPASRSVRSSGQSHSALSAVPGKPASSTQASLLSSYGKLPLSFEENQGQTDPRVKFLARGKGYTVFLPDNESPTFRLQTA